MARKVLTSLDFGQNQVQNAVLHALGSAPSSPAPGQVYYNSAVGASFTYNGLLASWTCHDASKLVGTIPMTALTVDPTQRANHTGTQLASTISNLATTVQAYTLNQFATPTAALSMGGYTIQNVAAPVNPLDAANKQYVDSAIQGLTQKPTAAVATVAALPSNVYSNGSAGVGATLTASSNGVLVVDTYTVPQGATVLVKNEATAANNGLYVLTQAGTASLPYILTRHVDMDQSTEFGGGFIAVENNGSATANTLWLCNVANTITVGTTAVTFTQLNSPTVITAGNGINVSANVVSAVAAPNSGISVSASGISAVVNANTGLTVGASGIGIVASNGISVSSSGVAAVAASGGGLTVSSSGIAAVAGNGIAVGTSITAVAPAAGGLTVGSTGISAVAGNGISVSSAGIAAVAATNSGISVSSSGISTVVNTATGLLLNASGINIVAYNGISVSSSGVAAVAAANAGISVSASGISAVVNTNTALSLGASGITIGVVAGGGVLASSSGLSVDTTVVTRKYAATIGDGSTTAIVVTHNLNTRDVMVTVYDASTYAEYEVDCTHTSVNTVTINFTTAPASNSLRVVVQG